MLGVIGHDGADLTLRQICQRFDGVMYVKEMQTSKLIAGIYNANGGISESGSPRAAQFTDFHIEHARDERQEIVSDAGPIIARAAASLVDV